MNGLPIGAMKNFKYDVYESKVETGDVILIMSDGMPELQNKENEMYGYDRLKKVFTENAEKNSHDIISAFNSESITWSGDKEPDDDITFVVIKVK
ncbi:MAG: PP2C family protein-serine/threonine phosphatase [Melioribacteraceae bacterium]|nr:PP2C family protein-serine/threonine phosphatase [Melioribacteraceae bacterium]